MFNWLRKLLGMRTYSKSVWYVEGYEDEHTLDYGQGTMVGPFKTENKAIEYGMKIYHDGFFNVDVMWRP